MMKILSPDLKTLLLDFQRNERTEADVYFRLAAQTKSEHNRAVLTKIANEELGHAAIWQKLSGGEKCEPSRRRVRRWSRIAKVFGLTFGVRFMERGEAEAQKNYEKVVAIFPEAQKIIEDEERHEQELIELLNEKKLEYVGSIVLGLNDALVELTGALAGFSFALQNSRTIAVLGLITGVAASFSMAASEYLSTRAEGGKNALTSSVYTGIAYVITTILLVTPFFVFENYLHALGATLTIVILIIAGFNFYIAVAKHESFKKRFWEMAIISLGVATLSFGIGVAARLWLGVEI